ncbi:VOC family protein [Mucilaginibacter gilvus]|uniref:VOC family protein n=1 Tax=Mucilaginibacter gilvus TaxID=2305909 RepID=A0A3S3ZAW5_9SPHI|nr:VOC family protein [Mucilaginibacter gilvus]RWY57358.1 VOC family protein [Mucilaginibacter gilvus]
MAQRIGQIALLVKDYAEAIDFYCQKLGFVLIEDTVLTRTKRWVLVAPPNSDFRLLLARAVDEKQLIRVGNQTGGRVFLFLYTNNFWNDYHLFLKNGVTFIRDPFEENYGTVAVFEDLYGNLWDLIEERK